MFSNWAYVPIGNNNTGKTSFQKHIVNALTSKDYQRLALNAVHDVTHPRAPRRLESIFTCNRSYQEKLSAYRSVEYYFRHYFEEADICFLSSHRNGNSYSHVEDMIRLLKERCYNVAGVFWSNGFDKGARKIAQLAWTEVLWIENPILRDDAKIAAQLEGLGREFSELLLARAGIQ